VRCVSLCGGKVGTVKTSAPVMAYVSLLYLCTFFKKATSPAPGLFSPGVVSPLYYSSTSSCVQLHSAPASNMAGAPEPFTNAGSTHTMHLYSSSPKSLMLCALAAQGFHTTASGRPLLVMRNARVGDTTNRRVSGVFT